VVSTDEKTGIQALERLHPDVAMGPGRLQKRQFEYVRHGTLCLMANLEVWCGQIMAPSIGPTRTEQDFKAHVEQTVNSDPLAGWVFIVDNLDTPQSESLVRYVAAACAISDELGKKGKDGVLKSKASRAAFLSEPSHADPLRGHAQAQLVAEPDRDLVQHPGQEVTEAVQLLFARRPQGEDPALHRLLQPDDGQTHRLALLP
jgi:hypothetical protein